MNGARVLITQESGPPPPYMCSVVVGAGEQVLLLVLAAIYTRHGCKKHRQTKCALTTVANIPESVEHFVRLHMSCRVTREEDDNETRRVILRATNESR